MSLLLSLGVWHSSTLLWSQGIEASHIWEGPSSGIVWTESASQEPAPQEGDSEKDDASEGDTTEANAKKKQDGEGSGKDSDKEKAKDDQDDKKKSDDDKDVKKDGDADQEKKDGDEKDAKKGKGKDDDKKDDKDDEEKPEPLTLPQEKGPVLFLTAERLIVRPGKEIENGKVIVRNGRVQAVGADLAAPEGARTISGKVICAGFVDPWSTLGVDLSSRNDSSGSPTSNSKDAVDLYGPKHELDRALHAGVLAVESHVATRSPIGGTGVLLRTVPSTDAESAILAPRSAMWARLERSTDMISRIQEVDSLVKKLESGADYLAGWRKYEKKFAEWETEIKELEEKLEKGFKKAKKDRDKALEKAKKDGKKHKEKRHKDPKPPKRPKVDPDKEALGRVANGEIPLVVVASRAAVLRNLLEGTKKLPSLRLIIAGGNQAMHVAPELANRNIPVMVWPAQPLASSSTPSDTNSTLELAGELARAGVPVLIGSGEWGSSAALPLYASLAVGYGMPEAHALAAITTRVASAFDLSTDLGMVRRGRKAEMLVLDGDPLSVGTQVQFVISDGKVVVEPKQ